MKKHCILSNTMQRYKFLYYHASIGMTFLQKT